MGHARAKEKARVRIAGNKSVYIVSIHEVRHHKVLKSCSHFVKDDPLASLIVKSPPLTKSV